MRQSAVRPRRDQIDALTRGVQLPLPAIEATFLEVIAESLSRAFHDVCTDHPGTVDAGSEAEVTALLVTRLNEMLDQDPLLRQLVNCVVRGAETVSFDGSRLEKRPDLSLYLSSREHNFPLVAETKILDSTAAKTEVLYCDKGLRRFLEGEYAWANREAIMIAYVRDDSSINGKLTPFLSEAMKLKPPRYSVELLPVAPGSGASDRAWSRHGRTFLYTHQSPPAAPGAIRILHLWLSCETSRAG